MKFQRLKLTKFPRATGTTPGMTITKMCGKYTQKSQHYKSKKDFDKKPI